MRYTLPFVMLLAIVLPGCGMVTSSKDVSALTQSHAVAIAEQYYDSCSETQLLGQCALLSLYTNIEETKLDPSMRPYVRTALQPQADVGTLAQRQVPVLVLTKAGATLAVNTLYAPRNLPTRIGGPATAVLWRVADVSISPAAFSVHGDTATLSGTLVLTPTPLFDVLGRQNLQAAKNVMNNESRRVNLHLQYDVNAMRWQVTQ